MKTIDELLNQITPEEQAKCDADMIEQIERKAFQDCTAIIKKKLSDLINKREMLANAYNEMMADIPNCPNQFNSPEYKVVDRQCELLYEILRRIEEESK